MEHQARTSQAGPQTVVCASHCAPSCLYVPHGDWGSRPGIQGTGTTPAHSAAARMRQRASLHGGPLLTSFIMYRRSMSPHWLAFQTRRGSVQLRRYLARGGHAQPMRERCCARKAA